MNKILALLLVFLITISSVIAADLSVINIVNPVPGNPGSSVSGSFNVKNQNINTALNGITFVRSDLTHTSDPASKILSSSITFNPASIAVLNANEVSSAITSTVAIQSAAKAGTYTGNVEVRDSTGTQTTIFPLSVVVNNFPKINVDTFTTTNPLEMREEQGETATGTFTIRNEGNVALSNLDISHNVVLTDADNDTIVLSFTGLPASLNTGSNAVITARAAISDDVDFSTYSGTVTVKDLVQNTQASFALNILVEPTVCSDGVRSDGNAGGDNLKLTFKDPKSSDRFAPGEEINIKISVKNNDNSDMDVVVNVFLFDLDDSDVLVEGETETILIDNGETEDFELTLKIPTDVDVSNSFALFARANEEDEEDRNCGESRRDTEIRRERHSVTQNKITFTPRILACGETFDAAIDLLNIGTTKEDGITVRLFDDELDIDQISNQITLDKFDNSEDQSIVRFRDIKLPANAAPRDYQVELLLSYDSGQKTESKFGTLTVNKCDAVTPSSGGESRKVNLQVLVSSFDIQGGESLSIPATITNTDKVQTQYVVELQNAQDFAESAPLPKTLTLNPGQSETVYFNVATKSSLNPGKYTGTVVVKSGNTILDTKAVTVTTEKEAGFFGGLGGFDTTRVFWIVADIILIIAAIFFIKLIFGRKKTAE